MTTQASDGRRQTIIFHYNNNIRVDNLFRWYDEKNIYYFIVNFKL